MLRYDEAMSHSSVGLSSQSEVPAQSPPPLQAIRRTNRPPPESGEGVRLTVPLPILEIRRCALDEGKRERENKVIYAIQYDRESRVYNQRNDLIENVNTRTIIKHTKNKEFRK